MAKKNRVIVPADLTDSEWAIMKVVWQNEPCAAGTVQEALAEEKGWAYSTVKTMMDRMAEKGHLKIKKIRNLQLFSSTINQTQARKGEFKRMLQRAFDGALGPMMQFLVENEKLTRDDLARLKKIVNDQSK